MNSSLLLQAAGQAPAQGNFTFLIMMVGMIVVMYFFMIRPQQKKAKEAKKFADSIQTGEKVVTTSGIHGRIVRTNADGTVAIEIGRNVEVTIERAAISMEMTQAASKRAPNPVNTPTSAEIK